MGNNTIKSNTCGLGGKGCTLADYPTCDRHSMIGVSKLPGEAPTNPGELRSWVDRWVETVGSYGGICQRSGIWSVYYGKRESAPLSEAPLTAPAAAPDAIAAQATGPAKAETDQEIEDAYEKLTSWKAYVAIASGGILLCLGLVAGTALAWKKISKWRASKPIAKAPPPPLSEEEPAKPEAVKPEAAEAKPAEAKPAAADAAREIPDEPVPIGPRVLKKNYTYKAGDPRPKGLWKAIAAIEHGFSKLQPGMQRDIAKEVWATATSSPENMRLIFRDGRFTTSALNHWRAGLSSSMERTLIGDKEVTLGRRILPKNFQGDAMEYVPRIIKEMQRIDTLFAKLPEESQTRIAKAIVTLRGDSPFRDGRLTVNAVHIGHGLARGYSREIAEGSKPIEPEATKPKPAKAKPATQPIQIGVKVMDPDKPGMFRGGEPFAAMTQLDAQFAALPQPEQTKFYNMWCDDYTSNVERFVSDGRLTVEAIHHLRVLAGFVTDPGKTPPVAEFAKGLHPNTPIGSRVIPEEVQEVAIVDLTNWEGRLAEMRRIDPEFAALPEKTQKEVARKMWQEAVTSKNAMKQLFTWDGKFTARAVGKWQEIAQQTMEIAKDPAEAAPEAEQPRASKFVTKHIDASREGAIIHEKLMREFPKVEGIEFSFASMEESERAIIVEGILMQIEDSIERNAWREHFVVADGQRAFKPGALAGLLERHLETANHPSLEGFRNLGRAETRRVPERSAERGKHGMAPPPPRLGGKKPGEKPVK